MEISIYCAHHREASDVELSIFVEKWFFDVLLDNIGSSAAVDVGVLYQTFDVVKVFAHLNAATSICVLAWFYNPEVLTKFGKFVQRCLFIWVLQIMKYCLKFVELGISETFFDVESEWQVLVIFFSNCFVVDLHVVEDSFLVTEMVVVLLFTVLE